MATQQFFYDDTGPFIYKDPNSKLDYVFDWSEWLNGDTLVAGTTVTVPAGLTKVSETFNTTTATVWISGGTAGATYNVSCHIVTAAGREEDQSIRLKVKQK